MKKSLFLSSLIVVIAFYIFLHLVTSMPGDKDFTQSPTLTIEQNNIKNNLQHHVETLAVSIGPRFDNFASHENLDLAADYIKESLESFGFIPREQSFGKRPYRNIIVSITGNTKPKEIIVIGAHYDSAPSGTPGADDNASGIAGLLEIARILKKEELARTIQFIAFTNEERPFFNTQAMGSAVSALNSRNNDENIIGMFSLEMLGYYNENPDTQSYPPPIGLLYPDTANFIAFIANMNSRSLLHESIAAFRTQGTFPSEGIAAPESLVPDIRRSDNSAYWDQGYKSVLITDTSYLRNPYYHSPDDTPDKLDFNKMARVVDGLSAMVSSMANNVE